MYMLSIFDLDFCDDRQENMALKVTSVIQQFTGIGKLTLIS